jgi:hypothetical protein
MNIQTFNHTKNLSDDELLVRVKSLAARERSATAELVVHLAELETRGLHLAAGYSSMHAYCHGVLGLSDHEAYNRIEAARTARRFPVVFELLVQGVVSLTTVRLLAPHLTPANHIEVLESARGLSRPQVEEIVARLAPKPDVPASVRKLATPRPHVPEVPPLAGAAAQGASSPTPATPATPAADRTVPLVASPIVQRAVVNPLSPDRYRFQLTIGGDTLEKLRLAKDLLRHANPAGDDAALLDRALTVLLADLVSKKFAASARPRASGSSASAGASRYIPAEVARAVFLRDFGRCAYKGKDGHRCNERAFVEFHHVRPFCEGGPPTVENLELRCRRHNQYEWRQRSHDVRVLEEEWYRRRAEADGSPRDELVLKRVDRAARPASRSRATAS